MNLWVLGINTAASDVRGTDFFLLAANIFRQNSINRLYCFFLSITETTHDKPKAA